MYVLTESQMSLCRGETDHGRFMSSHQRRFDHTVDFYAAPKAFKQVKDDRGRPMTVVTDRNTGRVIGVQQ